MVNKEGKVILIVEDDESIREVLNYALENEGYIVHTANNGQEALNLLPIYSNIINIILLDVMMPVMDGFTFYREKLKTPSYAQIPTIIYSADVHLKIQADAMGLPFLTKPFNLSDMFEQIEKYERQ